MSLTKNDLELLKDTFKNMLREELTPIHTRLDGIEGDVSWLKKDISSVKERLDVLEKLNSI